jgi:hypothetical protein
MVIKKRLFPGCSSDSNDVNSGSWRMSTVRSRCYGTAVEDAAGWKRLSEFCGNLLAVEITVALQLSVVPSGVYKWSINTFANPYPFHKHTHTRDNMNWSIRHICISKQIYIHVHKVCTYCFDSFTQGTHYLVLPSCLWCVTSHIILNH